MDSPTPAGRLAAWWNGKGKPHPGGAEVRVPLGLPASPRWGPHTQGRRPYRDRAGCHDDIQDKHSEYLNRILQCPLPPAQGVA